MSSQSAVRNRKISNGESAQLEEPAEDRPSFTNRDQDGDEDDDEAENPVSYSQEAEGSDTLTAGEPLQQDLALASLQIRVEKLEARQKELEASVKGWESSKKAEKATDIAYSGSKELAQKWPSIIENAPSADPGPSIYEALLEVIKAMPNIPEIPNDDDDMAILQTGISGLKFRAANIPKMSRAIVDATKSAKNEKMEKDMENMMKQVLNAHDWASDENGDKALLLIEEIRNIYIPTDAGSER